MRGQNRKASNSIQRRASGFWGSGSFGYDELGNITRKTLGNQSLNYSYNTSNRLAGITGSVNRSYSYDGRGNVTNNGQRTFTYNLANQLISSGPLSYQYDGYNRRVKKGNGATIEYSLYSSDGQLLMTDGSNGPTEYFYLGNKLVAKESQVQTSEDTPGYTGHLEDDDLQLTYMQQRYYDPLLGRFYSNDPVGFSPTNPMLFNRYAYANNNPYKYIDPDGRESYLVGRPLKGAPGRLAGHQYVVSHARYIGDTGSHVQYHSYGQNADGMLGKLSPTNEGALSKNTTSADQRHWASLAEGSAFVSQIAAADDVVAGVANSVVADTPYTLPAVHLGNSGTVGVGVQVGAAQLPSVSSVLNSNSAATAVANQAAGTQVTQPKSPGAFGYPGADRASEIKFKEDK